MALTSLVYYVVMRHTWKWPLPACVAVLALFLSFDLPFFAANTVKILDGGWVPVAIGVGFIAAMLIWSKGRTLIVEEYLRRSATIEEALPRLLARVVARLPGRASSCRPRRRTRRRSWRIWSSASMRCTSGSFS